MITNLLFLQLFVGVVIETFNQQKDILSGKTILKKRKLDYVNI